MKILERKNEKEDKKIASNKANKKALAVLLIETRQSHTIEYVVTKIVQQRCWKENKSPAVQRGSAARRCISVPMCESRV